MTLSHMLEEVVPPIVHCHTSVTEVLYTHVIDGVPPERVLGTQDCITDHTGELFTRWIGGLVGTGQVELVLVPVVHDGLPCGQ